MAAQTAQTTFGKNRVQHRQFDWKFVTTKHFNIYYYNGGNKLAHNTARHLETNFEKITHVVGYLPYDRINILVYNADSDLQQSNISLQNNISSGGETKLIKSKIEISFKGNQSKYYQELNKKLSELFINTIMFGGNLRDKIQSTYLIDFPAWFISGASEYIGYGTNEEMYNAVRYYLSKKRRTPDRLNGEFATLIGQSIYHYIEETYGQYTIANILSLTKATRNEETGIENNLGVPYQQFIDDWADFYTKKLKIDEKIKLEKIKKTFQSTAITQLKTNPSKTKIAYAINKSGIYSIIIYDVNTKRKTTIFYGGVKNINWKTDQNIPVIAWRSDTELSLIKYKKGKPYLITKDISARFVKEKKLFVTFDAIQSFEYSSNQKDIALSGIKNGQSDIYVYNIKTNVARQITKDLYDDLDPSYSPSGAKIIFSSNRLNDTLRSDYGRYLTISNNFNLFEFKGSKILNRLTLNDRNESKPRYINEDLITFLSSNNIHSTLYSIKLGDDIAKNIFNPNRDIIQHLQIGKNIYYHTRKKHKDYIYIQNIDSTLSTDDYILKNEQSINPTELPIAVLLNNLLRIEPFKTGYDSDTSAWKNIPIETTENSDNYVKISYPKSSIPQFGIDYVISTIEVDPIRNIGTLFEIGTSDMYGDHRISGTLFASTALKSSKLFAQYEYLKHNIDFKVNILKDSYQRLTDVEVHKQSKTEINFGLSKPFTPVARIELNSGISRTSFIDYFAITSLTEYNNYSKTNLQFVYDNTIEKNLNQLQGFRMKAGIEQLGKLSGAIDGYNKIFLDVRKYQHLVKNIILATRISYGRYGGKLPRVYMLGGVDNWLLQKYNEDPEFDPLAISAQTENPYLLYSDFTTNLRGFNYNQMNGNSHYIINTELRIPIVQLFYNRPISSSFLRNLQLNLFYDTGSAWNGAHPFGEENSINTRTIGQEEIAFTGEVINYQNPILNSYGLGIRSMIFGYYMKLDLGWGIQNYTTQKPKLQLSLGYDF